MSKRMLIDATHREETRVAIIDKHKLVDLDVESTTKQTVKGNIYLAKVIRIEPSLQAAFVEYGGNRHGFLAFSEIHPDYYRIPVEDREALLAAHASQRKSESDEFSSDDASPVVDLPAVPQSFEATAESSEPIDESELQGALSTQEVFEERRKEKRTEKSYKIQEVIKKRQILLIQVMKEERGGKGAALTTFLSLAGRYCVLMPNTDRGGGISRKITNGNDRKRLRKILDSLTIPKGMGVIVRTAGLEKNKTELKKDTEYLLRLWNDIRETTLNSIAPALVHEESALLKRALRDHYSKDIDDIWIHGDEAFKEARNLMKMMMPSHAKKIQQFKDPGQSLFQKYGVETQIDALHNPVAPLPSGGYLVINPTEALVSVDVNSGRSTKERNVEETAFRTNLEAADEVARQLRLRDLAGLVVIDFIDMDDNKNNQGVERRLKEALKSDKARIQVGHISNFGLMELSRQRLRPSFIESNTLTCAHCKGTGTVRSTESMALQVLRLIQEEIQRESLEELKVTLPTSVALYLLNQKRSVLGDIENHSSIRLFIDQDPHMVASDYKIDKVKRSIPLGESPSKAEAIEEVDAPVSEEQSQERPESSDSRKRNRNRRRERPQRERDVSQVETSEPSIPQPVSVETSSSEEGAVEGETPQQAEKRRNRRGRRGNRRRGHPYTQRGDRESSSEQKTEGTPLKPEGSPVPKEVPSEVSQEAPKVQSAPAPLPVENQVVVSKPKTTRAPRASSKPVSAPEAQSIVVPTTAIATEEKKSKPAPRGRKPKASPDLDVGLSPKASSSATQQEPRKGWWQRLLD